MRKQGAERVKFTTIQSTPAGVGGRTAPDLMDRMQARLPDGSWIEGVEVFRVLYQILDMGWWVPLSRVPGISYALDWAYLLFAKHRVRIWGQRTSGACKIRAQEGMK